MKLTTWLFVESGRENFKIDRFDDPTTRWGWVLVGRDRLRSSTLGSIHSLPVAACIKWCSNWKIWTSRCPTRIANYWTGTATLCAKCLSFLPRRYSKANRTVSDDYIGIHFLQTLDFTHLVSLQALEEAGFDWKKQYKPKYPHEEYVSP